MLTDINPGSAGAVAITFNFTVNFLNTSFKTNFIPWEKDSNC